MLTLLCFNLYLSTRVKTQNNQNHNSTKKHRDEIDIGREILLSQSPRSEHFCDEIDVPISSINPGSVELHNVLVLQCLEKVNFTIESLKIFRAL